MKKIIIVITNFRHGGTNKSLQNLLSIIDTNYYNVDVFVMDHFGPYKAMLPNCNILRCENFVEALIAHFNDTKGVARLRSLFIKLMCKLGNYIGFDIANFIFKCTARRFSKDKYDVAIAYSEGVPTKFVSYFDIDNKVAWVRCDYSNYLKLNNYPNERNIYESFKAVVCVSDFTKQVFCKQIPNVANRTFAIHNIINSQGILKAAAGNIDDKRFFTSSNFVIISIGRIDPVKRFSEIPKIARLLIDSGCDFSWYIVGDGGSVDELNKLYDNINKYNVNKYVLCLGGKNNPYPYIAKSDLLVNTSISEACPNVINEAKIIHKPVVCSDFGSASEFIDDGVNGYIVPIEQMADKIELLIKDKKEYNKMMINISNFIYNNELYLKQVYNLL